VCDKDVVFFLRENTLLFYPVRDVSFHCHLIAFLINCFTTHIFFLIARDGKEKRGCRTSVFGADSFCHILFFLLMSRYIRLPYECSQLYYRVISREERMSYKCIWCKYILLPYPLFPSYHPILLESVLPV
jgi:hypothetical protein